MKPHRWKKTEARDPNEHQQCSERFQWKCVRCGETTSFLRKKPKGKSVNYPDCSTNVVFKVLEG